MLPYFIEIDYIQSETWLPHVIAEEQLCYFDSAKYDDALGRYSFICFDPIHRIKSHKNVTTLDGHVSALNPFQTVNELLSKYQSQTADGLPPYQGGAAGYFGYDLLHHLESITPATTDIINVPDMMVGVYDCVIAFDNLEKRCWIISQGFPETNRVRRQQRAKARAQYLQQKYRSISKIKSRRWHHNPNALQANFSQTGYCDAIQKTRDYILAGDIYQANITQCFHGQLPEDISGLDLYLALREKNPAPFAAFLNFAEVCIASASPERFLQLQKGGVETRPIKGTRPRGSTAAIDKTLATQLLHSEKDRAENTMIVDLMRNDLARVCAENSVEVTQLCGLESFETVHHLVSVIKGQLKDGKRALDLLAATFPPGSITGAPKVRAMEIIYELEPCARGVYCGSIGYIGFDGTMDTSVVIRTYTIKDKQVYIQAGGGIVADSIPIDEYHESVVKARALQQVLQAQVVE